MASYSVRSAYRELGTVDPVLEGSQCSKTKEIAESTRTENSHYCPTQKECNNELYVVLLLAHCSMKLCSFLPIVQWGHSRMLYNSSSHCLLMGPNDYCSGTVKIIDFRGVPRESPWGIPSTEKKNGFSNYLLYFWL